VITAAHCLPALPPPHPGSHTEERTFANLLGPRGESPTVWAECLFVDPVADLAVLCEPDNQVLLDENEAYERLIAGRVPLAIDSVRPLPRTLAERMSRQFPEAVSCPVRLMTLDGQWDACEVQVSAYWRSLTLVGATLGIAAGTSGSPILTERGQAIGVISVGSERWVGPDTPSVVAREQAGQPALGLNLPAWLRDELLPCERARRRERKD
jgi:hypothetical protein